MATLRLKRERLGPLRRREARAGLLFTLPWLISLLVFTAYPVLGTFSLAFTEYAIVDTPRWIGLNNFRTMFQDDPAFWTAVRNSAIYAGLSVPLRLGLALGLAMLLNLGIRGIGIYRALFYLPSLVPPIAATLVFVQMFSPDYGPIDAAFQAVGLPTIDWFDDPSWSKVALVILSLWSLGVETLVFLAGLKDVPSDLTEAAQLDGAGRWRRFLDVTVPMITPVILFNLVIGVIGSFQVFSQAVAVGGTTGEPLESTLMFMVLIYRNAFSYFAMGYAAALAVVLFLSVLMVTLVIFRSARVWVYYEGSQR